MDTKRYLYSIRDECREIEQLKDRIERLREKAEGLKGIAYDGIKVQTSPEESMADALADVVEYEKALRESVKTLCKKRTKARHMIDGLEDPKERQVLDLYFLSGSRTRMQEVSEKIGYSERRTYDIYKAALEHLPDTVDQEQRQGEKTEEK